MNLKLKKIFIIALTILITASPIVHAQTMKPELPKGIIVIEEGNDKIYIPDGSVKDTDKLLIQLNAYLDALRTEEQINNLMKSAQTSYLSDSQTRTINNNTATGTASLSTDVTGYDGISARISGYAQASYSGMYGHVPDSIELTNQFTFTGINLSIPIPGSSEGGSWGVQGKTLSWNKSFQNTSSITHRYSGIGVSGFSLHLYQAVIADFGIGTNFYTIMASDSALL